MSELDNNSHKSLSISLQLSWNRLKMNISSKLLWGIISLYPVDIPSDLLSFLPDLSSEDNWNNGLQRIIDHQIAQYDEESLVIRMVPAIKSQWFHICQDINFSIVCEGILVIGINRFIYNANSSALRNGLSGILTFLVNIGEKYTYSIVKSHCLGLIDYYKFFPSLSITLLEHVITEMSDISEKFEKAIMQVSLANMHSLIGNYKKSINCFLIAESIFKESKDAICLADVLIDKAMVLLQDTNHSEAEKAVIEALDIYLKEGDVSGISKAYYSRANILVKMGKIDDAIMNYKNAYSFFEQYEKGISLANIQRELGKAYMLISCFDEAEHYLDLSYDTYKKCSHTLGMTNVLRNKGEVAMYQGRYELAQQFLGNALKQYEEQENILGITSIKYRQGDLARLQNKWRDAFYYYLESRKDYIEESNTWGISSTSVELLLCSHMLGWPQEFWENTVNHISLNTLGYFEKKRLLEVNELIKGKRHILS